MSARTLRRWARNGLIRGEWVSPHIFHIPLREEMYIRQNWPLLRRLRLALRTEPTVRTAVLFGSWAIGKPTAQSDVDIAVRLADSRPARLANLSAKLSDALGLDVQLARTNDVRRSPGLWRDLVAEGRVLVDRDKEWQTLASTFNDSTIETDPLRAAMEDLDRESA